MSDTDASHAAAVPESTDPVAPDASVPQSTRHLAFGAAGMGIGLVVGLVLGFVVLPIAGSLSEELAPSRIPGALESCDVESDPWITAGDNGNSLSLQSSGDEAAGADVGDIVCVLDELDIPDSVLTRMSSTRALDGRQAGEWDEFSASWGYHPDNGLDVVIETVQK
ncbi:hypothetical protein ACX3O0_05050 [Homoserinimonas sp. A447]